MALSRRAFLQHTALTSTSLALAACSTSTRAEPQAGTRATLLPEVMHGTAVGTPPIEVIALNRMGYGPRPGDIERVRAMGFAAYVEEQLHPDAATDPDAQRLLASATLFIGYDAEEGIPALQENRPLRTLNASVADLWHLNDWDAKIAYPERVRPVEEIQAATIIRAVASRWQLHEVLAEFWHNHFNVNAGNDDTRISAAWPAYDRDVIRAHAFGNFRTFLEAVATSQAMLAYLDNASSKASPANENYARELFELHTLGAPNYLNDTYKTWRAVPGALEGKPIGYIDQDVYEAARAFTGWTIADGSYLNDGKQLPNTGAFVYHDGWHDPYQKRVLGVEFEPNQAAMLDGRRVLDLVAYHPGTARYVCTKLCRRLVSDTPPNALIERAVATWTAAQQAPDQIGQTVRAILLAPEFATTWGQKVKRPFETVVSFLRATGAEPTPNSNLTYLLEQHGYRLFTWPAPNGHPDVSAYWLSSNVMLGRWNMPLALMADWTAAARFDLVGPTPNSSARTIARFWAERMLGYAPPDATIAMLARIVAQDQALDATPAYDDDTDRRERISALVTLIAMLPAFQLK